MQLSGCLVFGWCGAAGLSGFAGAGRFGGFAGLSGAGRFGLDPLGGGL